MTKDQKERILPDEVVEFTRGPGRHRTVREAVCANCGKTFMIYGSTPRKYCCHECYVLDRFGAIDSEM